MSIVMPLFHSGGERKASSAGRLRDHHRRKVGQEDAQSWMMVYLDVVTLLLVLFVVMMMQLTETQPSEVAVVPEATPEVTAQPAPEATGQAPLVEQAEPALTADLDMASQLKQDLARHDFQGVQVTVDQGRVNVSLPDKVLFDTGRADLISGAAEILDRIVPVLASGSSQVSVEGHTDDRPIATRQFPSNWELSSARAASVIRFLASRGIAIDRMRAVGYADTQPLVANDTPEGRSRNRRVNLVIHPPVQ